MILSRATVTAILLVMICALLAPARLALAGPGWQETTPTTEAIQVGTPPDDYPATQPASEGPLHTGTLLATVMLLACGMLGMLAAGIGIAVVMGRLRTRRPD